MAANQIKCLRLQQRFVMKFLLAEKCKQCEIYRRVCDIKGGVCISEILCTNGLNCFKKSRNSI